MQLNFLDPVIDKIFSAICCILSKMSSSKKGETGEKAKAKNDMVAERLEGACWEGATKVSGLPPVNGHTGIFAFHADDCMCSLAGWPCARQRSIWSCCGSTDRNSQCTNTGMKNFFQRIRKQFSSK